MDNENIPINNDVLHSLSNLIKEFSKDQLMIELKKLYTSEEIILSHKVLLESLSVKKSTIPARKVKHLNPFVALLDCYHLISEADMPVFIEDNSKDMVCSTDIQNEQNTTCLECTAMEDNLNKKSDFEELRQEQDFIKAHLTSIVVAVDELRQQMKLLFNSTSFLVGNPLLIENSKSQMMLCNNFTKTEAGKTGVTHLQKLIDQEAGIYENIIKDTGRSEDDNDNERNELEGTYPDSSVQKAYKEISLVEGSADLTDNSYNYYQSGERSIEIISQDDGQLRRFNDNSQEIIVNAEGNARKNCHPRVTVIKNSDSIISNCYSCSLCGALFQTEAKLIKHACTHKNGTPLVCSFCHFTCITIKVMKKHLNFNHPENNTIEKKKRILKCVYCGVEFQSKESLKVHIQNHYEEKNNSCFECQVCFAQFPSRQQLARHKKIEHKSTCPFQCNVCGARFTLKLYLHNHKRTHINVKPHGCSYCSQRFINRSKLTLHERTHTGEKPFECSYCEYRSSRQDNMKYHINSRHINRTTIKCSRCDIKFPNQELQDHLALHNTQLPYQCLECNRMFKSLGGLRVHYKSSQVHNKRM